MALVYKDRVKQVCSAPTTTDPFDFTGAATATGYQTFVAALADGDTVIYGAEDADGDWEVGIGTWTEASDQLARTTILASSNSGSAETFSGDTTVYVTADAAQLQASYEVRSSVVPGGRLTLTSGVAVTTSDVTAATSIYYTPYENNVIPLWDGTRWKPISFTEKTLALGTITDAKPYDVFGYLSSGDLALEMLAWTNDTTRATAITIQDGKYCKSGDHTRLYLGTFYTTSTTTTEDSEAKRYLWNMYNQVDRFWLFSDGSSNTYGHTYQTAGYRKYNNGDYIYVDMVAGLQSELTDVRCSLTLTNNGGGLAQFGVNWTDGSGINVGITRMGINDMGTIPMTTTSFGRMKTPDAGRYRLHAVERVTATAGTVTWAFASIRGHYKC